MSESQTAEQRFVRSVPPKQAVLVLIEAYMDESGTGDGDTAHILAGYLIRAGESVAMSRKWERVLSRYNLPFFHMTDCAAYDHCEPYKSLGRDKCIQLATKLIKLIKKHCIAGFAVCFNPMLYSLFPDPVAHSDNPYSFSVGIVNMHIQSFIKHQLEKEQNELTYVFEAGHSKQRHARVILDQLEEDAESRRIPFSYSFQRKTEATLLQAADILAWHCQTYIKGQLSGRAVRRDFASILELPHMIYHFSNAEKDGVKDSTVTAMTIDHPISSDSESRRELMKGIYLLGTVTPSP